MTLNDIIDQRFQDNLIIAYEELSSEALTTNGKYKEYEAYSLAREWTIDDMSMQIAKYIDDKWKQNKGD